MIKPLYDNTLAYAGGASRDGVSLEPIQQKMVEKYLKNRIVGQFSGGDPDPLGIEPV